MPYPFAHPVAVLPLVRPMGRFAAPSALAIGSVVPDLWYFVPFVNRTDSHGLAGLLWFCLPIGALVYAMFHLLLKEPLIALLSPRLGAFACAGLPRAPWYAGLVSLAVGAATHQLWDALTHSNDYAVHGHNWAQHASTALGTLVLVWWGWRKLKDIPAQPAALAPSSRICIAIVLVGVTGAAALIHAVDTGSLRTLMRSSGMAAMQAAALAIFVYCTVWHLRPKRATSA